MKRTIWAMSLLLLPACGRVTAPEAPAGEPTSTVLRLERRALTESQQRQAGKVPSLVGGMLAHDESGFRLRIVMEPTVQGRRMPFDHEGGWTFRLGVDTNRDLILLPPQPFEFHGHPRQREALVVSRWLMGLDDDPETGEGDLRVNERLLEFSVPYESIGTREPVYFQIDLYALDANGERTLGASYIGTTIPADRPGFRR